MRCAGVALRAVARDRAAPVLPAARLSPLLCPALCPPRPSLIADRAASPWPLEIGCNLSLRRARHRRAAIWQCTMVWRRAAQHVGLFLQQHFASRLARVIDMSCDSATQARDAFSFATAGYALREAQPFDLFPQTTSSSRSSVCSTGRTPSRARARCCRSTPASAADSPGATLAIARGAGVAPVATVVSRVRQTSRHSRQFILPLGTRARRQ